MTEAAFCFLHEWYQRFRKKGTLPVRCSVVAIVGQKVVVELPEDVKSDAAVGCEDVVVGFAEHAVERVQGSQVLLQEMVSQTIDCEQVFQFLQIKTGQWLKSQLTKSNHSTSLTKKERERWGEGRERENQSY
jgi:hypothetical protein